MSTKESLIDSYSKNSKHSNYQVLPSALKSIIDQEEVHTKTRSETERLKYITKKIDFSDKSVLDIGGNTGFFTFELLEAGAKSVNHYEGNKEHSSFVALASEVLGVTDRITATNAYFSFDGTNKEFFDVILLFNVLHHIGDDYGDQELSVENAKTEIIRQLNSLSSNCNTMVFQLGFNWQGDPAKPLFEKGTKEEVINFVKKGIEGHWDALSIGVADRTGKDGSIEYHELNAGNIVRDDSLGEFLNRPIFILKSLGYKK